MTTYYAVCLERDLEPNLANGWIEAARSWQLSCQDWQVLLEWTWPGEPPGLEVTL